MGNDCQAWINKYFRRKKSFTIHEKVTLFKEDTHLLNQTIFTFTEINSDDILSLYDNNLI
jgi:hypothetical protein